MADTLSLTAKLFFDGGQAVTEMGKVGTAFKGMGDQYKKTKAGMKEAGEGFKGVGYAMAGIKIGIGASVKRLADFEGAMGGVKAKLGKDARPSFEMLENEAMRLGSVTQFTAAQAANAMEELAAGGMKPAEIMKAIGPVLDTAAAEGMSLADAAKIVSQNLNAFGPAAGGAANVANTLARVSALTSSSILSLQEGLKYAAGTARQAGVPMQQTVAILGALSDVGLEGSLAGTAFQNAILRMSQRAKDGKVEVGDFFAKIEYGKDGVMDAQKTFLNMVAAINKVKDPMKKVQTAQEAFGIRGKGVALAMDALTDEKVADLFTNLEKDTKDAAREMAKLRMEGLQGDMIRLRSAVDGAMISLGKMFRPTAISLLSGFTKFLGDASAAMSLFAKGATFGDSRLAGLNQTAVAVVMGLRRGFNEAKDVFLGFGKAIVWVGKMIGYLVNPSSIFDPKAGTMGTSNLISMAMKWGAVAISLKLVGSAIGRVSSIATGTFKVLQGVLGGVKTGVGGLVNLLAQKFPAIGKLAGPLGKLGKGVAAIEKITAQPVRVVNWDEAGGVMGGGVSPKQLPLPLGGGPTAAGGPGGWRAAASAAMGKTWAGGGLAIAGGLAANTLITGETREATKTLANSALALGAAFGPAGMAVGGVAAAALAFGSKIDEWTGASDKISDAMWNYTKAIRKEAWDAYLRAYEGNVAFKNMQQMSQQLVGFAKRGITEVGVEGGKKRAITAEFMQERLMKFAAQQKGMTPEQQKAMVEAVMKQMGPELAAAMKNVNLQLNVDGRPVAKGVAGAEQENASRRGQAKPGGRGAAARK